MASVHQLIRNARNGEFPSVCVIVGGERFLVERAVAALRAASSGEGPGGFNDEVFQGGQISGARIAEAACTLPMMASARFVLVRGAEKLAAADFEALAGYLDNPSDTTCLVLAAEKLDGRTRFARMAKKKGFWFDAAPLKANELRAFATAEAKARGHQLDPEAAAGLIDSIGNDLSALDDALERLALFTGERKRIELADVEACISRVRVESIWALVDAVSERNRRTALHAAGSLLSDREPPLRILAMLARQLRMLARVHHALREGMSPQDAAKTAGAPPFKAQALARAARAMKDADFAHAFHALSEADLLMKGSKQPPEAVLERTVLRLIPG